MRDGLSPNGTMGTGSGSIGLALSMLFHPRQLLEWLRRKRPLETLESLLEKERDQLPLWLPVALGCGIAAWFNLASPALWLAFICLCAAAGLFAVMRGQGRRTGSALFRFFLFAALGCGLHL